MSANTENTQFDQSAQDARQAKIRWVHALAACMYEQAYGVGFVDREKQKWRYRKIDQPLTADLIDRHLSEDEFAIGAYVLSDPENSKGRVVIFDFDDHGGILPDGYMEAVVAKFLTLFEQRAVPYVVVRSGGGRGYHVFCVSETPKRNDQLREFGKKALASLDEAEVRSPVRDPETNMFPRLRIKEGTGGIEKGEIEIFPKGGMSLIALPLARKSVRMRLDDGKLVESPDDDDLPLIKPQKPGPKPSGKAADRDAAFDALARTLHPSNYDQWVKLGHMIIAAFGKDDPWAFERWSAWAMTAPNADPLDKQREKWERNLNSDPSYSRAAFWMAAKDAGYEGELPFTKKDQDRFEALDILAEIDLFRSSDGFAYATIAPRRHVDVRTRDFTNFLRLRSMANSQMLPGELVRMLSETAMALASQKPTRELHLRFASDGERRYLFLADDDCTIIEIDAAGWRRSDRDVRFRRGDGRPLPMPEPGSIDDLRQFVNMSDDAWAFHLAWMVCCVLRPGLAAPIAVLTGPKGSAKSTALQFTIDLLDPKIGAKAGMPKSEDDLVVAAHSSAVVSFDNASTLATLSDPLCRLATGGGTRKRELYSDANVVALDVIRPVIISGIDPTMYQQDLVDRVVLIEMVPPNRRIDDEELAEEFDRARPRILGGFLTLCSQVMAKLHEIGLGDDAPRMAAFARVGEAVARILGHEPGWFVAEYRQMLELNAEEAAGGDCVYQVVVRLMVNLDSHQTTFSGTSQELLELMHNEVRNGYLIAAREDIPKNARAMSSRLRRVMHALKDIAGIEVTQSKHDRTWRIKRREVASDEEVLAAFHPPF